MGFYIMSCFCLFFNKVYLYLCLHIIYAPNKDSIFSYVQIYACNLPTRFSVIFQWLKRSNLVYGIGELNEIKEEWAKYFLKNMFRIMVVK